MSDQQQIWFIYLTDHHEGPFSVAEVADKVSQGLVNGQSLAWKDGMPEWVALETIPELNVVLSGGLTSAVPSLAIATEEEGPSLAQLLADQQKTEFPAVESTNSGLTRASTVLSSVVNQVNAEQALSNQTDSGISLTGVTSRSGNAGKIPVSAPAMGVAEPLPEDQVWTLRIGSQVSGLHSLNDLKELAAEGDIPPDALLWHPGWQDFQPLSAAPEVGAARRPKKTITSNAGSKLGASGRGGLAPITAAADVGNEEPTNPGIEIREVEAKTGFKGLLARLFARQKSRAQSVANAKPNNVLIGKPKPAGSKINDLIKRLSLIILGIGLVGGFAAVYFLFFASPIPSDLDVNEDDLMAMKEVVKVPPEQGVKLFLAQAKGTEDNPPDPTSPKYYVATNLPVGGTVSLNIVGLPGTLVNKISFEKAFTAQVGDNQLAVFEQLSDDGKPLSMGVYNMKVTAEGATEPIELERFLGGLKGAVYERRLKQFKDKLQESYDKEMQELREYVDTLKALQSTISQQIASYKVGAGNLSMKAKLAYDWKNQMANIQNMLSQIEGNIQRSLSNTAEKKYHPRAYEDISKVIGQIKDLTRLHTMRLEGSQPPSNPDELEGLVQTAVISLEQWLAEALLKGPFDANAGNAPAGSPNPATP